jgi:hypothetical protein
MISWCSQSWCIGGGSHQEAWWLVDVARVGVLVETKKRSEIPLVEVVCPTKQIAVWWWNEYYTTFIVTSTTWLSCMMMWDSIDKILCHVEQTLVWWWYMHSITFIVIFCMVKRRFEPTFMPYWPNWSLSTSATDLKMRNVTCWSGQVKRECRSARVPVSTFRENVSFMKFSKIIQHKYMNMFIQSSLESFIQDWIQQKSQSPRGANCFF